MTPMKAPTVLDQNFLDARCQILNVAAFLDRVSRGEAANSALNDSRMKRIQEALTVLLDNKTAKAERIQQVFSLDYDATWPIPQPKQT